MADEIDDAEELISRHGGFENDEIGKLFRKVFSELRAIKNAVRDLKARVDRLDPGGR